MIAGLEQKLLSRKNGLRFLTFHREGSDPETEPYCNATPTENVDGDRLMSSMLCKNLGCVFTLCGGLFACAPQAPDSFLNITRGKVTDGHPAVVQLTITQDDKVEICTGTFISDAVVLTAAHCFLRASGANVKVGNLGALSYQRHPNYEFHIPTIPDLDRTQLDIALVLFPKGSSKSFLTLTKAPENSGSEAIIVGYGVQSVYGSEAASMKREGKTLIVDRKENRYFIQGSNGEHNSAPLDSLNPNARYSAVGPGDSGGPLLSADGKGILGVASWTIDFPEKKGVAESVFNDVLGVASRKFLEEYLPKYGLPRPF